MKLILSFIIFVNLITYSQDFNVRLIKTIPDNFPRLITSLQVYDLNDEPIRDLKPENFNISVEGNQCDSINSITYKESGKGLNIMLCLDLSGTMSGTPLETMKNAVIKFLDEMRNVDKLAIIGFADSYELISDFSSDREYLKNKVRNLTTSGSRTALYYGTYQGLVKLRDNKDVAGKILLLIGDGKDESVSSSYTLDDVIKLAKEEGIPIFSIGYSKIDKSYLQTLEKMSEQTGGKFYNSPKDDDLEKQYRKLYDQILNIYILTYVVENLAGNGSEYTNVITINYKNQKKTASNKFISPAGIPAYKKSVKTEDDSSNLIYILISAGIIIIGAVLFFVLKSKKKKKIPIVKMPEEQSKKSDDYEIPDFKSPGKVTETPKNSSLESPTVIQSDNDELKTEIDTKRADSFGEKTMIVRQGSSSSLVLEVLAGSFIGKSFTLNSKGGIIGRQDGNDIVIKENNISRQHAKITFINGDFYIEDLNSSNGTYINGIRISQPIKLNNYDTFKFGSCEGRFIIS
ncbi:MAG: FHA domain-containing protein [Ignavibacterium sp.]|nr:FHA domain-containing protein [Ignavibacterium sp.]